MAPFAFYACQAAALGKEFVDATCHRSCFLYICQAGCGSGLAGTCGHHQQVLSESETDLLTYCADCFFLVVAVGDTIVDGNGHQIHALCSAVHELLQIVFAEYAANSALGAALIVPEVGFETVSGKHHGTTTELAFQTVSV